MASERPMFEPGDLAELPRPVRLEGEHDRGPAVLVEPDARAAQIAAVDGRHLAHEVDTWCRDSPLDAVGGAAHHFHVGRHLAVVRLEQRLARRRGPALDQLELEERRWTE